MTHAPAESLLTASDLKIGYPQRVIAGPLQLSVSAGSALGIIGVNGSGKSTLIHTLLGLLPALEGQVTFAGLTVDPDQQHFRETIAVQVSDGVFFEELTVAEHLEMVARGHKIPTWRESIVRELDFFELEPVADNLPSELSSGQRRKLLLAATLIRPSRLLVFDEPEQRLDWQMRQRLYQRLSQLHMQGVGVLAVTHDPQMLRSCLDQALLLDTDGGSLLPAEQGAAWLER